MENNEMKITVDGVTKTYRVILNLEDIDGKNFVIYTDDEKDYNFVCEVLNSIQNDGGKNEN